MKSKKKKRFCMKTSEENMKVLKALKRADYLMFEEVKARGVEALELELPFDEARS